MNLKPGWLILIALGALVVGTITGFCMGYSNARRNQEAEAVKAGHAHFVVVNEYGATKFEWLPNHGPEKPLQPLEKK